MYEFEQVVKCRCMDYAQLLYHHKGNTHFYLASSLVPRPSHPSFWLVAVEKKRGERHVPPRFFSTAARQKLGLGTTLLASTAPALSVFFLSLPHLLPSAPLQSRGSRELSLLLSVSSPAGLRLLGQDCSGVGRVREEGQQRDAGAHC